MTFVRKDFKDLLNISVPSKSNACWFTRVSTNYVYYGLGSLVKELFCLAPRIPPPENYTECYERYIAYIKKVVLRNGIEWQEADDVADEIYLRVMETDLLGAYDPNRVFEAEGRPPATVTFTAMLSSFVGKYCMNFKDKQQTRHRREPVRIEGLVTQADGGDKDYIWVHVLGSDTDANIEALPSRLDFRLAIARAHEHLVALPIDEAKPRRALLPDLFKFCVEKVFLDGKMTRKQVGAHFGLSDSHVFALFNDLRSELDACGFAPGLI